MSKKIQTLAKKLDLWFNNDPTSPAIAYFDYCILSYQNGNFTQCKSLFNEMSKKDKKNLVSYISDCYDNFTDKDVYKFYFNLL